MILLNLRATSLSFFNLTVIWPVFSTSFNPLNNFRTLLAETSFFCHPSDFTQFVFKAWIRKLHSYLKNIRNGHYCRVWYVMYGMVPMGHIRSLRVYLVSTETTQNRLYKSGQFTETVGPCPIRSGSIEKNLVGAQG